jgi:steroid delta-isomerase-like uncharacterized protein
VPRRASSPSEQKAQLKEEQLSSLCLSVTQIGAAKQSKKTCDLRRGDLSIVSGVSAMDDPKQLINRFVEELWNERRLEVADAIFAKDCVTHQLRSGVPVDTVPRGPQVIKEHVAGWIASFPDLRFSIEQMLSEGDRVVTQLLMEGTHQGAWLGIPASGKKMQIRMFTVHRVVQGKIVEDWVLVESLGVFQQLGVVPNTADLVGNFVRQQGN